MLGFDNFSTEPVEVGNAVHSNSRYGRELLAVLVNKAGLMCTTRVNMTDEVWQCNDTYDSTTREQALDTIDAWLAANLETSTPDKALKTTSKRTGSATKTNPAGLPNCFCGCGEVTNRNRNYRPGHDARHAGSIARKIQAGGSRELLAELPTDALRVKASAMAARLAQGKPSKARKAAPAVETAVAGTLKVGRWTYPAVSYEGRVTYDTKTERKVANPKQALRFVANPGE